MVSGDMLDGILVPFLVCGSVVCAVSVILFRARERSLRRASELEAVAKAMRAHYEAFDRAIDDPALSEHANDFLCFVSDVAASEKKSERFVEILCSKKAPLGADKSVSILAELKRLEATRPDLVRNIQTVAGTAIVMIFLRWPRNAAFFNDAAAEFASDQRKEFVALENGKDLWDRFLNGNGKAHAAA